MTIFHTSLIFGTLFAFLGYFTFFSKTPLTRRMFYSFLFFFFAYILFIGYQLLAWTIWGGG